MEMEEMSDRSELWQPLKNKRSHVKADLKNLHTGKSVDILAAPPRGPSLEFLSHRP